MRRFSLSLSQILPRQKPSVSYHLAKASFSGCSAERGWTRQQAYAICSVAVDLKISELVDVPNMVVSAFLPLDIFGK